VLHDIRVPIFLIATEQDRIAPWRSVFKLHLLTDTEVTFALTNGGHNAGILSEPGHVRRHFRFGTQIHDARYVDPDTWMTLNPPRQCSWWPAWVQWLAQRSGGPAAAPPSLGTPGKPFAALLDAPGLYVMMK
jgi:polyhydroxyalkanoate synthase